MILRLLPQLSQSEWTKRCSQLYKTDSILGPEAVGWGLEMMAMIHPPGKDRVTILEQMDNAKNDAALMRRIRKGWQAFGYEDCWGVVHDKPVPQLARYNSEPELSGWRSRLATKPPPKTYQNEPAQTHDDDVVAF